MATRVQEQLYHLQARVTVTPTNSINSVTLKWRPTILGILCEEYQ